MNTIRNDNTADLLFHLRWQDNGIHHTEGYHAAGVNFWRDRLPDDLQRQLMGKQSGDQVEFQLPADNILLPFDHAKQFRIKKTQFDHRYFVDQTISPRHGRFYPKGILTGVPNIFKANQTPFRCGNIRNGHIDVDLNHPLANSDLKLSVIVGNVAEKPVERGGTSVDWINELALGPGMQARWQKKATDFFSGRPFVRADESTDSLFYHKPRLVHHTDAAAIEIIRSTNGRMLSDGMRVLDLMSSWQTYIPEKLVLKELVGLGLNAEELKANQRLSDYRIQDLNREPQLPFADNHFEAVISNVSVEYLTHPFEVIDQVARVLSPGGIFLLTFSNRWFPPKVVRIWQELHEFERVGLVLEYFLGSGKFSDLRTYSFRGLPRPVTDRYFPKMKFADPVFAVWGRKKQDGNDHRGG